MSDGIRLANYTIRPKRKIFNTKRGITVSGVKIDKTLDMKGLTTSRLNEFIISVMETMTKGEVLRVITNELKAKELFPNVCREKGYEIIKVDEEPGVFTFTIQK